MDYLSPYLLHLTIFCTSLLLIILFVYNKKQIKTKFPPGSTGWPLIGETLELASAARQGIPEKFVSDRTNMKNSDVFKTSLIGNRMAVFCGPSGNKFIFSKGNQYVRPWLPSSIKQVAIFTEILKKYPGEEYSSVMENFLPQVFKPDAINDWIPLMDSMAKEQLGAYWLPNKEVKVLQLSKKYTFELACRLFMSIKDPMQVKRIADPFSLVARGILTVPINFPGTAFSKAVKGGKIIREELLAIVRQRSMELLKNKAEAEIDVLSRLLLALGDDEAGKTLNQMKIASMIIGLLIASYDTTSTALTFAVNYLTEDPNVYKKVLKEHEEIAKSKAPGELLNWGDVQKMKYTWCVCCESMRLSPPAQGAFGEAMTNFTYSGFTIPKGWKTHWTVYSTHKDPKYFPNPEKFDPSRFEGHGPAPFTFVPFGGGPRMCPGKEYARFEILIFIHNLVTKYHWKKVIPDEKITYNPFATPVDGLPILLMPHQG